MGMFDTFRLDNIELPDLTKTDPLEEYQTKQLQCRMDDYRVTSDGRLVRRRGDREEQVWRPVHASLTVCLRGPQRDLKLEFAGGRLMTVEFDE